MRTNELKEKLATVMNKHLEDFNRLKDADYRNTLSGLSAGQTAPAWYKFSPIYQDKYSEICENHRAEANSLIEDALHRIRAKKTEAPTQDATNYLLLLEKKPAISENDITTALEAYGDNYSAYCTIKGIAQAHEILSIDDPDLDTAEDALSQDIQPGIYKIISPLSYPTAGLVAMFNTMTLSEIPDMYI